MPLVNCSRINSYVGIPIWSHPSAGDKSAIFSYYFDLFNSLWFTKISLMQNHLRKSSNNTLASLVCEIKSNLDKTVHFIVEETHRLHNAVTELDIAKLTSCFFKFFITRPLVITMLRYLAFFLTSWMDLLIHTKHNLLMSNNLDQIWFWKNIPITFFTRVYYGLWWFIMMSLRRTQSPIVLVLDTLDS